MTVVIIVAVIAALVLGVLAIGASLPKEHVATANALVELPVEKVWGLITSPAEFPAWRADVKRVEVREGHPRQWTEYSRWGAIAFVTDEEAAPARLVTRITDDTLPYGGTWTWALGAEGPHTRVTLTERGFVKPPMFRFLSRFVFGQDTTMKAVLASLRKVSGTDGARASATPP